MAKSSGKAATTCPTTPRNIWEWLTCGMCWEVKAGVVLLGLSWIALLGNELPTPRWRLTAGWICYWSGVACLVYGLGRDVIIMAKALAAWHRRRHQR